MLRRMLHEALHIASRLLWFWLSVARLFLPKLIYDFVLHHLHFRFEAQPKPGRLHFDRKHHAEVVEFHPETREGGPAASDLLIVVIPGNPGLIEYYEPFMSMLWTSMGKRVTLLGVGHRGHSKLLSPVYGLSDQVTHKQIFVSDAIAEFQKTHGRQPRVILVGHSVGSYICHRLLATTNGLPIVGLVNLFPTVFNLYLNRTVTTLAQPAIRIVVSHFVAFLPMFVKRALLRLAGESRTEFELGMAYYSSPACLQNVLEMARHEHARINEIDTDMDRVISDSAESSLWLFTPVDQYVSLDMVRHLQSTYPKADMRLTGHLDGSDGKNAILHAFVMRDSEPVARIVAAFLQQKHGAPGGPAGTAVGEKRVNGSQSASHKPKSNGGRSRPASRQSRPSQEIFRAANKDAMQLAAAAATAASPKGSRRVAEEPKERTKKPTNTPVNKSQPKATLDGSKGAKKASASGSRASRRRRRGKAAKAAAAAASHAG